MGLLLALQDRCRPGRSQGGMAQGSLDLAWEYHDNRAPRTGAATRRSERSAGQGEASMTKLWPQMRTLRSRLTVVLVVGVLSGAVAAGALAQSAGKSADRQAGGPGGRHRPRASSPRRFKEAPQLAELVKAGKLPPVAERIGQDPLVIKPLQRDRQVRRHLARAASPGPADFWNGFRVLLGTGPAAVLGLHGRQGRAEHRQGPRDAGRRQGVAPAPAPRA